MAGCYFWPFAKAAAEMAHHMSAAGVETGASERFPGWWGVCGRRLEAHAERGSEYV